MQADCSKCGAEGSVDYVIETDVCSCEECGAMFEVEPDADFDGDHYVDASTPGREIR